MRTLLVTSIVLAGIGGGIVYAHSRPPIHCPAGHYAIQVRTKANDIIVHNAEKNADSVSDDYGDYFCVRENEEGIKEGPMVQIDRAGRAVLTGTCESKVLTPQTHWFYLHARGPYREDRMPDIVSPDGPDHDLIGYMCDWDYAWEPHVVRRWR